VERVDRRDEHEPGAREVPGQQLYRGVGLAASAGCGQQAVLGRAQHPAARAVGHVDPAVPLGVLGPLRERSSQPIARVHEEQCVEALMLLLPREEATWLGLSDLRHELVELVELGVDEPWDGHPQGQALVDHPERVQVLGLVGRELGDGRSHVDARHDEPLALQEAEGLAHRTAADAVLHSHGHLHQIGPGGDVAAEDACTQVVVDRLHRVSARRGPDVRHSRTTTDFTWVYPSSASTPFSRPCPDLLTPPKGSSTPPPAP
jgi:hypothetical protein